MFWGRPWGCCSGGFRHGRGYVWHGWSFGVGCCRGKIIWMQNQDTIVRTSRMTRVGLWRPVLVMKNGAWKSSRQCRSGGVEGRWRIEPQKSHIPHCPHILSFLGLASGILPDTSQGASTSLLFHALLPPGAPSAIPCSSTPAIFQIFLEIIAYLSNESRYCLGWQHKTVFWSHTSPVASTDWFHTGGIYWQIFKTYLHL